MGDGNPAYPLHKDGKLRNPSIMIVAGDSSQGRTWRSLIQYTWWADLGYYLGTCHSHGCNILYADWHVSWSPYNGVSYFGTSGEEMWKPNNN